jgi:hypothetical protein
MQMKTITLRLDDLTYKLFLQFALADNRPISNMIETAAKKHLEECLFVGETEMHGIREDRSLQARLKSGSRAAKARAGRFVD